MPRGYIAERYIRANAYYELKAVPVKNRVYHYWYFRFFADGRMRSVYCGKEKPTVPPLEAYAAFEDGKGNPFREPAGAHPKPLREPQSLPKRFREPRSLLPKPRRRRGKA